jgi:hypothetical protein
MDKTAIKTGFFIHTNCLSLPEFYSTDFVSLFCSQGVEKVLDDFLPLARTQKTVQVVNPTKVGALKDQSTGYSKIV